MRLLRRNDTGDFSLTQFPEDAIPPYAILSHTWGADSEEVTFDDLTNGTGKDKPGYKKIQLCGEQALQDSLEYFWIDTCCIDKSSSAELSEAINSMFFWYSKAVICYTYLSDVHQTADLATSLGASRWFTRGWTLQELLAPKDLVFYSAEWQILGDKTKLTNRLEQITKIPTEALQGTPLNHFSIAEKMSWASKRVTTRVEDVAYSLMGIFEVNMPLLYGEREKAFLRLQQYIMQESNDQSLFAWRDPSLTNNSEVGILARSPQQFEHSSNVRSLGIWTRHDSFAFTNNGLRIELWLIPIDDKEKVFLASLACCIGLSYNHSPGIYVKRISGLPNSWRANHKTQFVRVHGDRVKELNSADKSKGQHCMVHVLQEPNVRGYHDPIPRDLLTFDIGWNRSSTAETFEDLVGFQVFPTTSWNPQTRIFTADQPTRNLPNPKPLGAVLTQHKVTSTLTVFGVTPLKGIWVKTFSQPPFEIHDWATFEPSGRETITSHSVISETTSTRMVCEAKIWTNHTPSPNERTVFVILISVRIVARQPPFPVPSKATRELQYFGGDPQPKDGG